MILQQKHTCATFLPRWSSGPRKQGGGEPAFQDQKPGQSLVRAGKVPNLKVLWPGGCGTTSSCFRSFPFQCICSELSSSYLPQISFALVQPYVISSEHFLLLLFCNLKKKKNTNNKNPSSLSPGDFCSLVNSDKSVYRVLCNWISNSQRSSPFPDP